MAASMGHRWGPLQLCVLSKQEAGVLTTQTPCAAYGFEKFHAQHLGPCLFSHRQVCWGRNVQVSSEQTRAWAANSLLVHSFT